MMVPALVVNTVTDSRIKFVVDFLKNCHVPSGAWQFFVVSACLTLGPEWGTEERSE